MTIQTVTDAIRYVGVDDNTLALFENQYPVQPMGVSYNSYVILDEKIAVMDSVDARAAEEWLSNVARVLEGRSPDYLVVTHIANCVPFQPPRNVLGEAPLQNAILILFFVRHLII